MRELVIFKKLLEKNHLTHLCTINGFGKGKLFLELENRNWIVYEMKKEKVKNKRIHLSFAGAVEDVFTRIAPNPKNLIDNYKELCEAITL